MSRWERSVPSASSQVAPQPKPAIPNRSSRSVNGQSSAIRNGSRATATYCSHIGAMIRTMTEVAFAQSGDVSIAYRVVGDGPVDLVYVQGAFTHLDVYWELPAFRRYCERLAEFSRLVLFDKRGMGMSDRVPGGTPLDVRMDDIRAVMDAIGSESAVVMGESEGAPWRSCSRRPTRNERGR